MGMADSMADSMADKQNIYSFTFEQLAAWLEQRGFSHYWAGQVWEQLYREHVSDFTEMDTVNDECIALLTEHFSLQSLDEVVKQEASDGTVKFLFKLPEGNVIETVLMRQKFGLSVCVTTQVGCNIGCSFCASGLLSKQRNLTSGEIVEQIMKVQCYLDEAGKNEQVSHIVVMGIGEPFDNYEHVANFIRIAKDQKGLAIAPRRITVSTSGLAPKIKEFADSDLKVSLAISLHAPNNAIRTSIMKINQAYPLEVLMEAIDYYIETTNQRVMIEYILLSGINDQPEHALELSELLCDRARHVTVNLIPYNPVDEHSQYERSSQEAIVAFYDVLRKQGLSCTVRQEHGADIDAACGQLRSKQMNK